MQHGIAGLLATFLPIAGVLLTGLAMLVCNDRQRFVLAALIPAATAISAWILMETAFEVGHMLAVVIYIVFFLLLGIWYTGLLAWFVYRELRREKQ